MQFSEWFEKQSGLTQKQFADEVGVSQGRIAQLLAGGIPSMRLAARIRQATGGKVTPNDFNFDHARHRATAG